MKPKFADASCVQADVELLDPAGAVIGGPYGDATVMITERAHEEPQQLGFVLRCHDVRIVHEEVALEVSALRATRGLILTGRTAVLEVPQEQHGLGRYVRIISPR
jgi:hypothetical protein